jgi:transposase
MICDMILSGTLKQTQMAEAARCSERGIQRIARNLRLYGKTKAPSNGAAGRRRRITPQMLDALREHLLEKPGLYQDEMAIFLYDEFSVLVIISNISKALKSIGWSKKVARREAKERNPDLRDYYLHSLSEFRSYHLVYVDESGCDKRIGFRRTGWSPLGVAPVQVAAFHRDSRYHILPAYTQDGVLFSRVF